MMELYKMKSFLDKHKKIIINILWLSYPSWGFFLLSQWHNYEPEIPPAVPSAFSQFYIWITALIPIVPLIYIMMISFLFPLILLLRWRINPGYSQIKKIIIKTVVILLYIIYLLLHVLFLFMINGK